MIIYTNITQLIVKIKNIEYSELENNQTWRQ